MTKNKFALILIILYSILLYSCQSTKEAFSGKKRSEQKDEFLVEKKNPLAMPPDYEKLPAPGNQEVSPETFSDNSEVKDLLNIEENDEIKSNKSDTSLDLENSIIKKIQ